MLLKYNPVKFALTITIGVKITQDKYRSSNVSFQNLLKFFFCKMKKNSFKKYFRRKKKKVNINAINYKLQN